MTKGGYKYVPKEVIEELDKIKMNFKLDKEADCFRKIVENSRIGREIRINIDFNSLNKNKKNKWR